jgi:anti-sigma B factor antagonist
MDELKIEVMPGIRDGIRILRLSGPFTLMGVFEFQTIFRATDEPVTVIDLTEVPYIDSASLGALIGVHTSSQRHKRHYALVGVTERVRTLFYVGGVEGILVTYPTLEEAQTKFATQFASN